MRGVTLMLARIFLSGYAFHKGITLLAPCARLRPLLSLMHGGTVDLRSQMAQTSRRWREQVRAGTRVALARAITLIESRKPEHRPEAREL